MKILVTGSSGLIGSEVCSYFGQRGHQINGVDNNQRAIIFGPKGDTSWRLSQLVENLPDYSHYDLDIRDRTKMLDLVKQIRPDAVVHTAPVTVSIKPLPFLLMILRLMLPAHLTF